MVVVGRALMLLCLGVVRCSEPESAPVSKISIPEAVLDTQSFRFSTMPGAGWPLTISIVAADGCFYYKDKKEVVLYEMRNRLPRTPTHLCKTLSTR